MNIKVTIALLLVFLMGLVVFLVVNAPPAEDGATTDPWPGFASADVTELTWDSGLGEVRVRRVGDDVENWEVLVDERWAPAEAEPILDILNELERFEVRSRKAGDLVDAQVRLDAGLEPRQHWFRFVMRGETYEVTLGKQGLGRDTIFAGVKGSDDVLVVGDGLKDTLVPLRIDDLRRRRIFRWVTSDIDRLEIVRDGVVTLKARRHETDESVWWAEFPYRGYLSPEGIEGGLLGWLLRLEVSDHMSDSPDEAKLEECGFGMPRFRVTIRKSRGVNVVRTILFGADLPDDPKKIYFRIEGQPFLFAAKKGGLIKQLEKDAKELRDRNLTRLGWQPLAAFGGEYLGVEFLLTKEEGVWSVTKPEGMTAEVDTIEDWFNAMRALPILEFADDPDLEELGLAEPVGRLTFRRPLEPDERATGATVAPVVELLIGKSTEKGVYVRRAGQEGAAFLAPAVLLDVVKGGAWQFRAKGVFDFRPRDLAPTEVVRTGLEKDLATQWSEGGWTNGVTAELVKDLSAVLMTVRAARWVGPAEGRDDEFGTGDAPVASLLVTFGTGEKAKLYGLRIGKEAPGGRYARAVREGEPGEAIFVITKAALDLLFR